MSNRTIASALSIASISLLSIAAHADETTVVAPPVANVAPAPAAAPAPNEARAQADDAEEPAAPDVVVAQAAPAPAPAPVYAPPPPPPYAQQIAMQAPPFPDREGFTIGFAVGAGHMSLEDTEIDPDTTVGLSFRLGAAVTPNFLLQGDIESTRADFDERGALQLNFFGVSATGYLAPRFYLVGGIGMAQLDVLDRDNESTGHTDDEVALLLGLGVEAYQSAHFALSIEARAIGASFSDGDSSGESHTVTGANLLLGFQWF